MRQQDLHIRSSPRERGADLSLLPHLRTDRTPFPHRSRRSVPFVCVFCGWFFYCCFVFSGRHQRPARQSTGRYLDAVAQPTVILRQTPWLGRVEAKLRLYSARNKLPFQVESSALSTRIE